MNCKNCNSEIPDKAAFCPVCGQKCGEPMNEAEPVAAETAAPEPVKAEESTQKTEENVQKVEESAQKPEENVQKAEESAQKPEENATGAYVSFAPEEQGTTGKKPGKGNKKKVVAIAAAVLLVAIISIGVTAHAQIANFVRSTFSDAETYYQYVEKKNCESQSKTFTNVYGKMRDSITASSTNSNASYRLELGQTLKTMLSMTGLDCSALDSIELATQGKADENVIAAQLKGLINDQNVISFNAYVDLQNKEGYFQIPELSEKFVDFSKGLKEEDDEYGISSLPMTGEIEKYIPKKEQVETLIKTYSDLFIESMDHVEKGSAEIEAGGVKSTYTDLKVTCKAEKAKDIMLECLKTLKEDTTVKEYLENIEKDAYSEFTKDISSSIEKLEATHVDESYGEAVMDVYVDSSGDIVGRVIRLTDDDTIVISCLEPQKGSEFGSEISLTDNDKTYFKLSGKGTRKGGKISGEYTFGLDESLAESFGGKIINMDEVFTIKVTDLDEDTFQEEGYLNGSFVLSTKAIASFTSYEIQLDSKQDKDGSTQTISVVCGGDKLASLIMKTDNSGEPEIVKPDEGSEIYDAADSDNMMQYMSELKFEELLSSIKEKCGVDLSTYMEVLESLLNGDEDDYDVSDVYSSDDEGYSLNEDDLEDYLNSYDYNSDDYDLYDNESEDYEGTEDSLEDGLSGLYY